MAASVISADALGTDERWTWETLSAEVLPAATLFALVVAVGILLFLGIVANQAETGALLVAGCIFAAAALSRWLAARSTRAATYVLVAGLLLTVMVALHFYPQAGVAAAFGPTVVLIVLLLDWWFGAAAALVATLALLKMLAIPDGLSMLDVWLLILGIWSGLPLSWLLTQPARTALAWAWHSYDQAFRVTQELRDRQAELGRLTKSLQETCYQLECLNLELAEARSSAEKARQLKSQFATSISHELRTPLNLIIGFSEMMVMAPRAYHGEQLPPRYRGDVEAIYRNACHLSDLVDDVLELSQLDANRLGLRKEECQLAEVVDEAVGAVASMFGDKQLTVVTRIPTDLPTLNLDRTRIRQVLINLLNNASRFTDEGGVRISAVPNEQGVVVSVSDTGIGMKAEDLGRVFEEFHQVHGSGQPSRGGSGLGLAIAKRIVELHGGSIWAESNLGIGTTVSFDLPGQKDVVPFPFQRGGAVWLRRSDDPATRKRVLVLGEDPEPARILQRHLDAYQVAAAGSARDAQRAVNRGQVAAIIATSPVAAAEWRQAQATVDGHRQVPLLGCYWQTGRNIQDRLGVAEYLIKPVSRQVVRDVLRRWGPSVRDILIVDDDPEMLRLLEQMIASLARRYRIQTASDGRAALALMREAPPDAVFLDLLMPELDGYGVLDAMRCDETMKAIRVAVVTARGLDQETISATGLSVSKGEALTVGETVRWITASLDALLDAP